jgi:hypothetical protein
MVDRACRIFKRLERGGFSLFEGNFSLMTRNTGKHSGVSGSSTDISILYERAPLYYLSGALLLRQSVQCLYENTALDCKDTEL